MSIQYLADQRVFRLDTPHTTYLIAVADAEGFVGQLYYGPRLPAGEDLRALLRLDQAPLPPSRLARERASFNDAFPFEYPTAGGGDFRTSCLRVRNAQGADGCELLYESYAIRPGKPALPGLPACFGAEEDCETLELTLRDAALGLRVILRYTTFADTDAICRSVRVENDSAAPLALETALSAALSWDGFSEDGAPCDLITLHGSWAREREIDRRPLTAGRQSVYSVRGISSHQHTPFLALAEHSATQTQGRCVGMTLVYSGNFLAEAELDAFGRVRAVLGIHPEGFCWQLAPGEGFDAPEAILVCSDAGLGGMTRAFHDVMRRHLIRGQAKHRYSLVNSWEASYFQFDHDSLLALGRAAAAEGIEMLVLDDGWFGRRDDDNTSLGDWTVNEQKLPGGLARLGRELNALGVRLGLWVEPEMISPDSELYRAHPDYAMAIPGRAPTLARNQLILDLARPEVVECVWRQLEAVLRSAPIDYVKWDMNRPLTDLYSAALPPERQGEAAHRYMLGVYELQERLVTTFPDLLLENCCSGGGRFDAGMLYYSPQIWASDNTEAIDRLVIQEGTALVFPLSSMGAHVAACPSHTNGRVTPFATRGRVSLPGGFGYELDLEKLSPDDRALIRTQLAEYRQYGPLLHEGDYYRLASYSENHRYDAYFVVAKDGGEALLNVVQVASGVQRSGVRLALPGLVPEARYRCTLTGELRTGAGWRLGGLVLPVQREDYTSLLVPLQRVE